MDDAENRQATSAISTASGIEPPAKPAPAGIDAVTAAAGAMPVIDWNRTSRNPMAFARRPGVVPEAASTATLTTFVVDGITKADWPGIVQNCQVSRSSQFVSEKRKLRLQNGRVR